jgi:hypothetical protein
MTNVFNEVLTNASGVEEKLLGPAYPYWSNIKTPDEMGMSSDGSAIGADLKGLVGYVEVLATGGGASKTGGPLGNKFFLQTGGKCKDINTGQETDRFIYINNVPSGNIPIISAGMGANFSEAKGLIPGTMSNLNVLNPFAILGAFMAGSVPDCQELTMQTVDSNNAESSETHFVTLVDIGNMDPCNWGKNGENPVSNKSCKNVFTNMNPARVNRSDMLPKDIYVQIYLFTLGILGIYILYCLMKKRY